MQKLPEKLPETAGVYFFYNKSKVIYIGKAINLKRRVSSYFDLDLETKTAKMISEATRLSFIKVDSELEALLLEAKLIRTYMPHYNIISKDDKHPLYILITKEQFPRIISARKLMTNNYQLMASYGPFPSSKIVYSVLKMIRRVFPYSDHKIGKRACLYSHIGLCNPCPSEISNNQDPIIKQCQIKKYKQNIKNIKSILDGKIDKATKDLEKEMNSFSKKEDFENAALVRNQLANLKYITRPQMPTEYYMENPNLYEDTRQKELKELKKLTGIENAKRIECFDIAHLSGTNATASMVTFVSGEADKNYYRHFRIKKQKANDDYASMQEVAKRRSLHFTDWGIPDLIIVDGGVGQVSAFKEKIQNIPVVGIAKHPDRLIIDSNKIKLEGPALNLVSRMRDEAHRFARRYHHKLLSKNMLNSS